MSNVANSASISKANTTYTADKTAVTQTGTAKAGDTVTVSAYQDGTSASKALVVLQINSDGNSTVSVDKNNVVQLSATGSGTNMYISVAMTASDPNNWTVNLNTSGGSVYNFKKGNGGGGH